jgi:hypothetical protein
VFILDETQCQLLVRAVMRKLGAQPLGYGLAMPATEIFCLLSIPKWISLRMAFFWKVSKQALLDRAPCSQNRHFLDANRELGCFNPFAPFGITAMCRKL